MVLVTKIGTREIRFDDDANTRVAGLRDAYGSQLITDHVPRSDKSSPACMPSLTIMLGDGNEVLHPAYNEMDRAAARLRDAYSEPTLRNWNGTSKTSRAIQRIMHPGGKIIKPQQTNRQTILSLDSLIDDQTNKISLKATYRITNIFDIEKPHPQIYELEEDLTYLEINVREGGMDVAKKVVKNYFDEISFIVDCTPIKIDPRSAIVISHYSKPNGRKILGTAGFEKFQRIGRTDSRQFYTINYTQEKAM